MASSDEDDLEALRLAALATLKKKQEAQEPQGIQVLSSLTSPAPNPYQQNVGGLQQGQFNAGQMQQGHYNPNQMQPGHFNPGQIQQGHYNTGQIQQNHYNANQMHQQHYGGMQQPGQYGQQNYGVQIPYTFQQAVLKQQMRGRGRGFPNPRGRGRGRGRGFQAFPQNPTPQGGSALIVIQVEGKEEEKPVVQEKPKTKDSRPFLLRPQDKWMSGDGSSQESSPAKPKDTSKFRRYDDNTDSEDEDDVRKRRDSESSEPRHFQMNVSLDDVSSDTELDRSKVEDTEIEVHNNRHDEIEIHNETEENPDSGMDMDLPVSENKPAMSVSDEQVSNGTIDVPSALQCDVRMETSSSNISSNISSGAVIPILTVNPPPQESENAIIYKEDLRNVIRNRSLDVLGDTCNTHESDSTPLRDEGTPVQDELRQDDSVSNSYVTFSRFNRRNRRDSNSGSEDSEEEVDEDALLLSDKSSSRSQSDSESVKSDTKDDLSDISEPECDVEMKDDIETERKVNVSISPTTTNTSAKTVEQSQDKETSVQEKKMLASSPVKKSSETSPSSSRQSPVPSESSGSSSSELETSSSSSSDSDSEDSDVSSSNKKKSAVAKISNEKVDKKLYSAPVKTEKDQSHSHRIDKKDSSHSHRYEEKRVSKDRSDNRASLDKSSDRKKTSEEKQVRKSYDDKHTRKNNDDKLDRKYPEEKLDRKSSEEKRRGNFSNYKEKKASSGSFSVNHVKADPEFDATNYRDKETVQKSDRNKCDRRQERNERQPKGNERQSQDNSRNGLKRKEDCSSSLDRNRSDRTSGKDKRYFEEIGRLKTESEKSEYSSSSKTKTNEDRKSGRSDNGSNTKKYVKEKGNPEKDSKQDLKKSKSYTDDRKNKTVNPEHESEPVKSSKSSSNAVRSEKSQNKQRRRSDEVVKLKSSGSVSHKGKTEKEQCKRKSVSDSWKSDSESDSDSDSEKSVSSLSDSSSDSETESWRDKKRGAQRKTADIELEKRRRKLEEREKRTKENDKGLESHDRSRTQGGRSNRDNREDSRNSKYKQGSDNRHSSRNIDVNERRHRGDNSAGRQEFSRTSHNDRLDARPTGRKNFEELDSSDSERDVKKHRGVVSVVKSDRTKVTPEIPSLLNIQVTKPRSDLSTKTKPKPSKSKRLIIQVEKSSEDESSKVPTKLRKKKKKSSKSWSSDDYDSDDDMPQKQVVNVTFNEDSKPEKSKKSVYDRLGIPVKKTKDRDISGSGDAKFSKRTHDEKSASVEKRVKLNEDGKYTSKHSKKHRKEEGYDNDSALNQRIQKIQEKNAEILRRKQLVEQDKQIYG